MLPLNCDSLLVLGFSHYTDLFLQPIYAQPYRLRSREGSLTLRLNGKSWLTSTLLGVTSIHDTVALFALCGHGSPLDSAVTQ